MNSNNVMSNLVRNSPHQKQAVVRKNKKVNDTTSRSLTSLINVKKEKKTGKNLITDALLKHNDQMIETKPMGKVPKPPKSLFPFMRKGRRRENNAAADQAETFKSQAVENENTLNDFKHNKKEIDFAIVEIKNNTQEPTSKEFQNNSEESFGFKKLKISNKQPQKNIHADYASRVARVRQASKDQRDFPLKSSSLSQQSRGREKTIRAAETDVSLCDVSQTWISKRGSSFENVPIQFHRRRSSTTVNSNFENNTNSHDDVSNQSNNAGTIVEPVEITPNNESSQSQVFCEMQSHLADNNNATRQHDSSSFHSDQLMRDRCSLDLSCFTRSTFSDVASFLASLPGPETTIDDSESSLTDLNTPTSSVLQLSASTSVLSDANSSVASSRNSLCEKKIPPDFRELKVQWSPDTKEESDTNITTERINTKSALLVRRSKSVCKNAKFAKLTLPLLGRRSSSPSFNDNVFQTVASHHETAAQKPPIFTRRNHSLKNLSSYRRPSKPTTPKPRKMSSSSSTSSLNMFNFQLPLQNLNPGINPQVTTSRRLESHQEPSFESTADVRGYSSVKNARILRRMSLQLCRSVSTSEAAEEEDITHSQDQMDKKRHSIAGLDSEKGWSIATVNRSINSTRRTKRSNRPLSEMQNLRWEVKAIPEHKEIPNSPTITRKRLENPNTAYSMAPCSDCRKIAYQPHENTAEHKFRSGLLSCSAGKCWDFNVLGSCFSEEDISNLSEEEFIGNTSISRSLSISGEVNTIPGSLLRFYPIKYCSERLMLGYNTSGHVTQLLSTISQRSNDVKQGHFLPGISNESGYGTMTRPDAVLRPRNGSEDDVFAQRSSARSSNGDFPNENGLYVEALWDHVTMDDDELGFKVGDVIRVIDMSNADWWWGELDSHEGWFPATFVRILVNQHRDESEVGDVIPHSDDETLSTSSHEYFRVTNFGDDICQCTGRSSASSVHCAQCGRPIQSVDLSPANHNPIKITKRKPSTVAVNFNTTNTRKNTINRDHIRKNVIKEIVNSEKVFAGHLKDVIEGYLTRCRKRPDMFSEEQISILFGNIEEIYDFQQKFASELEAMMNKSSIHKTELGNIFLSHISGFSMYSEYCNNHPQALALLSQLLVVKKYVHFFEACRLLQKMIDIPLDGFLLTPVQKICKYPLQLAELLKYTSSEHPDHQPVQSSLNAMKDVARMINERKRMMENITKISLWQSSIFNWQGEDVLLNSNELVYSGEVQALSQVKNKPKPRMAFLFDNQIIVCKKDLLRKDLLHYKSRINLQHCEIVPVEKSSPRSSTYMSGDWSSSGSNNTQYGWRITNSVSGESSVMLCKHEKVFDKWMKAFSQERQIALSNRDADMKNELMKDQRKPSLTAPRKPKEFGYIRAHQSFRYRNKLAQEDNQVSNQKIVNPPNEKYSASFFSSVAGKLTPFRRATVRETNLVA